MQKKEEKKKERKEILNEILIHCRNDHVKFFCLQVIEYYLRAR
jgi:hypothetical protein